MNIHIHVQPGSATPLYRQIADEVKAAFLRGDLEPGERLPSVRELAGHLSMNPATVVKAYDLLANERLIVRRQGQGAFVADGNQPLHDGERKELIARLARQLAIEGRRVGMSEEELREAFERELASLRPIPGPSGSSPQKETQKEAQKKPPTETRQDPARDPLQEKS